MPFHVTDKGNSGVCRVNLSNPKSTGCPFGGVDEHFETREGANAYAEGVHKPFLDVTTYDVGDVGRGLDLMAGRSWRYIHTGLSDAEAGKLNEALNGTKLLSQRDAISLSDAVEKAIESQQKEEHRNCPVEDGSLRSPREGGLGDPQRQRTQPRTSAGRQHDAQQRPLPASACWYRPAPTLYPVALPEENPHVSADLLRFSSPQRHPSQDREARRPRLRPDARWARRLW